MTNYKSFPKCPARQLSQICYMVSLEPKTIKTPCTFHDFLVHCLWVSGGNWISGRGEGARGEREESGMKINCNLNTKLQQIEINCNSVVINGNSVCDHLQFICDQLPYNQQL